ncbi:MAG: Lrp/AsnC family transcriptional regulator [Sphingomonas fennica]
MPNMPKFDRIDIDILAELQQRGRVTDTRLADEVGLSASPCHAGRAAARRRLNHRLWRQHPSG